MTTANLTTSVEVRETHKPENHPTSPDEPASALVRWRIEPANVLRWGGGVVFAAAAVTFMFQGLYSFNPMTRHWIMLALSGLLGLIGIFTGTFLKEGKGARVFLGFAAASFPVLASQLGAMLFSLFGKAPLGMPQPLVYSLTNVSKVMTVAALTLAITIPTSLLAFRTLARSKSTLLVWLYTLANLCILIPTRETGWLSLIILLLAGTLFWADSTQLHKDFRLNNFEGRISRLLLTIPLLVLITRTLFYSINLTFYGSILVLTGAYFAFFWGKTAQKERSKPFFQITGQFGIVAGWLICLVSFLDSVSLSQGMSTYIVLLPIALSLAVQSLLTAGGMTRKYRNTAAIGALASVLIAHWYGATPMVSVVGVLVGITVVSISTLAAEKPALILGALAIVLSLGNFVLQAIRLHSNYAWVVLALVGIAVMFSASLLEKKNALPFFKDNSLWGRLKTR